MKQYTKVFSIAIVSMFTVLASACTYNSIYEPWFDDSVTLEEQMRFIDATGQSPIADLEKEEVADNVYIADGAITNPHNKSEAQSSFVAHPVDEFGVMSPEAEAVIITENALTTETINAPAVSFVSAYIPYLKDSVRLDSKDRRAIKETATICKEYNCSLRVITYASVKNTNAKGLAEKRAAKIQKSLIKHGIAKDKIRLEPAKDLNVGDFAELLVEY